jgi:hypothetical protein
MKNHNIILLLSPEDSLKTLTIDNLLYKFNNKLGRLHIANLILNGRGLYWGIDSQGRPQWNEKEVGNVVAIITNFEDKAILERLRYFRQNGAIVNGTIEI